MTADDKKHVAEAEVSATLNHNFFDLGKLQSFAAIIINLFMAFVSMQIRNKFRLMFPVNFEFTANMK